MKAACCLNSNIISYRIFFKKFTTIILCYTFLTLYTFLTPLSVVHFFNKVLFLLSKINRIIYSVYDIFRPKTAGLRAKVLVHMILNETQFLQEHQYLQQPDQLRHQELQCYPANHRLQSEDRQQFQC